MAQAIEQCLQSATPTPLRHTTEPVSVGFAWAGLSPGHCTSDIDRASQDTSVTQRRPTVLKAPNIFRITQFSQHNGRNVGISGAKHFDLGNIPWSLKLPILGPGLLYFYQNSECALEARVLLCIELQNLYDTNKFTYHNFPQKDAPYVPKK